MPRKLTIVLALAATVTLMSVTASEARADHWRRGGDCGPRRSYYSSYSYRDRGCYSPPVYYRSYSRSWCAPAPYYGRGYGFSYSFNRYRGDCGPRYYRSWSCR
jgi:hypothetical protein